MLAAIDVDLGPGDIRRLGRAQEEDDVGDFRGRAEPAQRYRLDDLFRARRQDRRVDLAGGDGGPKSAAISRVSEPRAAFEVA